MKTWRRELDSVDMDQEKKTDNLAVSRRMSQAKKEVRDFPSRVKGTKIVSH